MRKIVVKILCCGGMLVLYLLLFVVLVWIDDRNTVSNFCATILAAIPILYLAHIVTEWIDTWN